MRSHARRAANACQGSATSSLSTPTEITSARAFKLVSARFPRRQAVTPRFLGTVATAIDSLTQRLPTGSQARRRLIVRARWSHLGITTATERSKLKKRPLHHAVQLQHVQVVLSISQKPRVADHECFVS